MIWLSTLAGPLVAAGALSLGHPVEIGLIAMAGCIAADAMLPEVTAEQDEAPGWLSTLPLVHVPATAILLVLGAAFFADASQPLLQRLGLIGVFGVYGCTFGINVAHELMHRRTRVERTGAGILSALACYGTFPAEHVAGHHRDVATPRDPSSAPAGVSVWRFLPRAILGNVRKGFALEAARLRRRGRSPWTWHNTALRWNALSVLVALGLGLALGPLAVVFFLGQALVAVASLEINNYVEHYGLRRRELSPGVYEPPGHQHCWSSARAGSHAVFLALPRHADHHTRPGRRFHELRHFEGSPQLPLGYAGSYLAAMVPPLWFRLMEPALVTVPSSSRSRGARVTSTGGRRTA